MKTKAKSSFSKALSLMLTLAMVLSMFVCMSGLEAYAIDITAGPSASDTAQNDEYIIGSAGADFDGRHYHNVCYGAESLGDKSESDFAMTEFLPLSQADITSGKYGPFAVSSDKKSYTSTRQKNYLPVEGNFYLTEDITLGAQGYNCADNQVLNICLNGYKVTTRTGAGSRMTILGYGGGYTGTGTGAVYFKNCQINLCDCDHSGHGDGRIVPGYTGNYANDGAVLLLGAATATFNHFSGAFDFNHKKNTYTVSGTTYTERNGFISTATGTYNMYGGEIKDGIALGVTDKNANTGNVFVAKGGTFNMYGGTVSGGSTEILGKGKGLGGNFRIGVSSGVVGTLNVYGGTISGGSTTSGGNIFSQGALNVYGGTIKEGTVTVNSATTNTGFGGTIYSSGTSSTLNITGGTISGGSACKGGNIYADIDTTISGGTISGGKATAIDSAYSGAGGNLYVAGSTTISGGTIKDGETAASSTDNTGLGGNIFVTGNLELSDCTIKDGKCLEGTILNSRRGGNIYHNGAAGTTFDIHEGTVISGGEVGRQGGNIWNQNSTFTMDGGTISGGKASTQGGNIRMGGVSTISGGTISGGTVASAGGNIFYIGASNTHTITGSAVIENGKSNAAGGNINLYTGTVNVEGGTITGGSASTFGGNINLDKDGTTKNLNVTGGTIYGGTATNGDDIAQISGAVSLNGAVDTNGTNPELYVASGLKATVGADFVPTMPFIIDYMNNHAGDFATATGIAAEKASYFITNNSHALEVVASDADTLSVVTGGGHCICGANSEGTVNSDHICDPDVEWTAWSNKTTLPGSSGGTGTNSSANGKTVYYYLTEDIITGSTQYYTATEPTVINICLNGHTVTKGAGALRLFSLQTGSGRTDANITLNICDCKGTAKVESKKYTGTSAQTQGQMFWNVFPSSTVNIFGGTYDFSNIQSTSNHGASIHNSGTFNVYGGEIIGSKGNRAPYASIKSFTVYGGTIRGGNLDLTTANITGGCFLISGGTLNIKGGTIIGGTYNTENAAKGTMIQGGAVYASGSSVVINMTGGKVYGSDMSGNGGAFYITNSATMNFSGGTVYAGNLETAIGSTAYGIGGAIYINTTKFTMSGNAVVDARGKTAQNGTGIQVGYGGAYNADLNGGTIYGGDSVGGGGALGVWNKASATIDGTVIEGGTGKNGGAVYVGGAEGMPASLTIKSGSVSGGVATNSGGNIYIGTYSNFEMTGGTVSGGKLDETTGTGGGNIYVNNYASATISGGIIKDGVARKGAKGSNQQGGNIFFAGTSKEFQISDTAQILNGSADQGGNIWHNAGTFRMTGGLISGGLATFQGGNMRLGAISYITGGRIENGTVSNSQGGNIFYINASNDAVIGGTAVITGGKVLAGNKVDAVGGNISIYRNATVQIKGGTISDGHADVEGVDSKDVPYASYGGNIAIDGTGGTAGKTNLIITGGTITGGSSVSCGGNIYAIGGANVQISEADATTLVSGGTAVNGGSIYLENSTLTLADATISGGTAKSGGNIYLGEGSTATITSGTVTGGEATGQQNGTSTDSMYQGGNIFVGPSATLTMNDGTVSNGKATGHKSNAAKDIDGRGGNIQVIGDADKIATFNMNGGTISGGNSNRRGGNLYICAFGVANMTNGTITDGTAGEAGGNVFVNFRNINKVPFAGTFNMSGGTIENGNATNGANIYLHSNTVANISNTAKVLNGGTYVNTSSTLNIADTAELTINCSAGTVNIGTEAVQFTGDVFFTTDVVGTKLADYKNATNGSVRVVDGLAIVEKEGKYYLGGAIDEIYKELVTDKGLEASDLDGSNPANKDYLLAMKNLDADQISAMQAKLEEDLGYTLNLAEEIAKAVAFEEQMTAKVVESVDSTIEDNVKLVILGTVDSLDDYSAVGFTLVIEREDGKVSNPKSTEQITSVYDRVFDADRMTVLADNSQDGHEGEYYFFATIVFSQANLTSYKTMYVETWYVLADGTTVTSEKYAVNLATYRK